MVFLLDNLTLRDILYVLNFPVNLLSVSKITKKLQYVVTFFPSYVLFQDLQTGRQIGLSLEGSGLYRLQSKGHATCSAYTSISTE